MTDIEGSTRSWDVAPDAAKQALRRHDDIVARAVNQNRGLLVESGREGDSILAVFHQATEAISSALDMQRALRSEQWPDGVNVRVRIAIHTGEAELKGAHYIGAPLYRCARLMAIAHGGQVLVSRATEQLLNETLPAGAALKDLGLHHLRDLSRPEQVFQLAHRDLRINFPPLESVDADRTNLPRHLNRFVGRRSDVSALRKLLATARLVSITGAGGIGKSRLAIELARVTRETWPDGTWWVDLAGVSDPGHVAGAVASALHLEGSMPDAQIKSWIGKKKLLLILDNCEHLVAACTRLCRDLLHACPGLSIVATSREALGVEGEARWLLKPMKQVDALDLFQSRARLVAPGFAITTSNRDYVVKICSRVDDLPLGIELAASKIGLMSPREMAAQLGERFDLLVSARPSDRRHMTLTTAIDWSYRLLTRAEATLFRRLSVFRGGFTIESAVAVCSDDEVPDVMSALAHLVEKSMVVAEAIEPEETRYRLLESQLVYAEEKLDRTKEAKRIHERHFEYFAEAIKSRTGALSGPTAGNKTGPEETAWKRRELSNLWAAARWARANRGDLGLEFVTLASMDGVMDVTQIRQWLSELLAQWSADAPARVGPTSMACALAEVQGDFETVVELAGKLAAELTRYEPATQRQRALMLFHLSSGLNGLGEYQSERNVLHEAMELLDETVHRRLLNQVRHGLVINSTVVGDLEFALKAADELLPAIEQEDGLLRTSGFLESRATLHLARGDLKSAERDLKRSLEQARSLGHKVIEVVCLAGYARLATGRREHMRAIRLAAANWRLSRDYGIGYPLYIRQKMDESIAASRGALGEQRADRAWREGLTMGLDQAIEYALSESKRTSSR